MLLSNIPSEYSDDGYCIAYRLNNGMLVYRYYDSTLTYNNFSDLITDLDTGAASRITNSDTYFKNYSAIMNADPRDIMSINLDMYYTDNYTFTSHDNICITEGDNVSADKAKADMTKVLEAYREDVEEVGTQFADEDSQMSMVIRFEPQYDTNGGSLLNKLFTAIDGAYGEANTAIVYPGYTNTVAALKEIGVLKPDNTINQKSEYYSNNDSYYYR